jgi:ABC-2 type transport system ATP-binding protein
MHQPAVVILDEPTSGLDPLMQSRFYELLRRERERGTTVLLSSHTLSEVQQHCEQVAIIRAGTVVDSGPIAELRNTPVRRIRLFASGRTLDRVAAIDDVQVERRTEAYLSMLFAGRIADFLAQLPNDGIKDLFIEEPSLEEVFLHYYTDEESDLEENHE